MDKKTTNIPTVIWLKDFCEAQGISPKTIRRLVKAGKIAHVRLAGKIGFLPQHIEDLMTLNTVPASSAGAPRTDLNKVIEETKARLLRKSA